MKKTAFIITILLPFVLINIPPASAQKELSKIAVWDLVAGKLTPSYAQDLTALLASEVSKLETYEVYSQDNVRTLAGWTEERMPLGCTESKCLTALVQMDISKLISGRVRKIGNTYSMSLNLFDTQSVRAEEIIPEECKSEVELIPLVRQVVRKRSGIEVAQAEVGEKVPGKAPTGLPSPLPGSPFTDPVTGMEFVFIKGGCFDMGDTFGDGEADEKPVHQVCVDDFYLGKYEVTQGQWEKVMGDNPSRFKGRDNPVERVSWNDVQQFIDHLNIQSGRKYRLPTEAEWEYAARSGGEKEKYAGTSQESELGQYAWYYINSGKQTHPVGQKNPNALGLHDMSGNVWEWCSDWYGENYYKGRPRINPEGPGNGVNRVLRGGSWFDDPGWMRAAFRYGFPPPTPNSLFGFRLGLSAR